MNTHRIHHTIWHLTTIFSLFLSTHINVIIIYVLIIFKNYRSTQKPHSTENKILSKNQRTLNRIVNKNWNRFEN